MIKIPCMEELEKIYNTGWSDWKSFPDPRKGEYLIAPFGSGVYQFRNTKVDKYVLFGRSDNVAYRMSSLLPKPLGKGTRKNEDNRKYVLNNLNDIEYRTISFVEPNDAKWFESYIKSVEQYIFST